MLKMVKYFNEIKSMVLNIFRLVTTGNTLYFLLICSNMNLNGYFRFCYVLFQCRNILEKPYIVLEVKNRIQERKEM